MLASVTTLAGLSTPLRVAVDLSFGECMSAREHRSVLAQLVRIYGNNRKHATPVDLHLSGLDAAPAASLPPAEHLEQWEASGSVTLLRASACDVWAPDEMVWLSPDAPQILDVPLQPLQRSGATASAPPVLVVGGLVDRSVLKGATLQRAVSCGAAARRLPVREHAARKDVHPILTLTACVHVLCEVNGGKGWDEAFAAAIPRRAIQRREREEALREARHRGGGREGGES